MKHVCSDGPWRRGPFTPDIGQWEHRRTLGSNTLVSRIHVPRISGYFMTYELLWHTIPPIHTRLAQYKRGAYSQDAPP